MVDSFSFPFIPIKIGVDTILRPLIECTLEYKGKTIKVYLLVDSGADFSMLRREVARDGLGIDLASLPVAGTTGGVGGETKVAFLEMNVSFNMGKKKYEQRIPFQVSLDESTDLPECLLGRIPFFYDFRICFRMGYTDDPSLGKFTLYYEEKKRSAERYRRPPTYG